MKKIALLLLIATLLAVISGCTGGEPAVTGNESTADATSAESETDGVSDTEATETEEPLSEPDAKLEVWYNHSFNKNPSNGRPVKLRSLGQDSYTVYMAKNEKENAQLYMYAANGIKGLTVEISEMKNSSGDTLKADLYRVYSVPYMNYEYPDVLVPFNEKTAVIDIEEKKSQIVIIRLSTDENTVPGDYSATVTVKQNGKPVHRSPLYCHVWDFELPVTPSSASAVGIWAQIEKYPNGLSYENLYKSYYDFMIDYRISAYYLPYEVNDKRAEAYMSDPRVTSFIVWDSDVSYSVLKKNSDWMKKAYFYLVDEPSTKAALDELAKIYGRTKSKYPGIRAIAPFYVSIEYADGVDGIKFMEDYTDIWCPVAAGFTEEGYANAPGQYVSIYEEKNVGKYPWLSERMAEVTKDGDDLWWYVCSYPPKINYCNLMIDNTGLQNRVLFWQQKQYGVTGFLYWACTYWEKDPWSDDTFNRDGSLLCPGKEELGYTGPCSTMRFEAVRDGLDDYDMLCMYEELCGKEAMQAILQKVTRSIVDYTNEDAVLAEARVQLGCAIEEALKNK